jgi:hypothetical protein
VLDNVEHIAIREGEGSLNFFVLSLLEVKEPANAELNDQRKVQLGISRVAVNSGSEVKANSPILPKGKGDTWAKEQVRPALIAVFRRDSAIPAFREFVESGRSKAKDRTGEAKTAAGDHPTEDTGTGSVAFRALIDWNVPVNKRRKAPRAKVLRQVHCEDRVKGAGAELNVLMWKTKVSKPKWIVVDDACWEVQSKTRAQTNTPQRSGVMQKQLRIAQPNQGLVPVVNIHIVELDWVASEIRVTRSGVDNAQRQETLKGELPRQSILAEEPEFSQPKGGMVLLRWFSPQITNGPDFRTRRVVLRLCAGDRHVDVYAEMVRGSGFSLGAPDRERRVASTYSGSGACRSVREEDEQ